MTDEDYMDLLQDMLVAFSIDCEEKGHSVQHDSSELIMGVVKTFVGLKNERIASLQAQLAKR